MSVSVRVTGTAPLTGSISIPGDKSISHRVALLASVASGASVINGFADSLDCASTLDCITRLGIPVQREDDSITINAFGLRGYTPAADPVSLDVRNSGSTIRMISGLLAGQHFTSELDGDESLRCRPMGRIVDPLNRMGATVTAREGRLAPLRIKGGRLRPIRFRSPVASAQVKSCVLLAGLFAEGTTTVEEPVPSRNHTELMLAEFGAQVSANGSDSVSLQGETELRPVRYSVPGDLSSAAFFIGAATLLPGSSLVLRRVGLNPTRTAFVDLLKWLGADITVQDVITTHGEQVGDLLVRSSSLKTGREGLLLSGGLIPNIIDEIPILAVVATQVEGRIEIRDAAELRVKESDRISSVVEGLKSVGVAVEEFDDGFAVSGPQKLDGGRVACNGDHRIAMAFTVAGLLSSGSTEVAGSHCANVSFPGFYELLSSVTDEGAIRSEPAR